MKGVVMEMSELERRVAALEREVANLKAELKAAKNPHPAVVLERLHGTLINDAATREAMRLGRKWRKSQG